MPRRLRGFTTRCYINSLYLYVYLYPSLEKIRRRQPPAEYSNILKVKIWKLALPRTPDPNRPTSANSQPYQRIRTEQIGLLQCNSCQSAQIQHGTAGTCTERSSQTDCTSWRTWPLHTPEISLTSCTTINFVYSCIFIARDARYWYCNSVRLSVRPSVSQSVCLSVRDVPVLDKNVSTYCHSFFSPYGRPIILVLSASNIFTKFRRGHPLWGH